MQITSCTQASENDVFIVEKGRGKLNKTKKVYLRELSGGYFFTEDVLEIIPIVLSQQCAPIDYERLGKYRKQWTPKVSNYTHLVSKSELIKVLEEFDVDKALITIVRDFESEARCVSDRKSMNQPVLTLNRDGNEVVSPTQFIYQIFKNCVCGVNWKVDECTKHSDCKKEYKEKIMAVMEKYADMDKNIMVPFEDIDHQLKKLKSHCNFSSPNEDYLLQSFNFNEDIPIEKYQKLAVCYQFFSGDIRRPGTENRFPVYFLRPLVLTGWIASFFDKEQTKLKQIVFDGLNHLIPESSKESMEPLLANVVFLNDCENNTPRLTLQSETIDSRVNKLAADREKRNRKLAAKKGKNKMQQAKSEWLKEWRDYSLDLPELDVSMVEYDKTLCSMTINQEPYISNFGQLKGSNGNNPHMKYFLLNQNDLRMSIRPGYSASALLNLEHFSKYNDKRFVVRAIPLYNNLNPIFYVLIDEILELIPVLMKKQGIPIKDYEGKLRNFKQFCATKNPDMFNSMPVANFKSVMEEFNIDKDKITIVPDIAYYLSGHQVFFQKANFTSTLNTDGNTILSIQCAKFHIFRSVICGVNWSISNKAVEKFKKHYSEIMTVYTNLKPGTFLTKKYVEKTIESLKTHKIFTDNLVQRNPNYEFRMREYDDFMPFSTYMEACKKYGLDNYQPSGDDKIPKWQANVSLLVGWIKSFRPDDLHLLVGEALAFKFQPKLRERRPALMEHVLDWIGKEKPKNSAEEAPKILSSTAKKVSELTPPAKPVEVKSKKTTPSPQPKEKLCQKNQESQTEKPKPSASESKLCDKCTRNGQKLLEAQAELQTAVNKANKYEDKAKKTIQVEKDMKKMKKENEELKQELEKIKNELMRSKNNEEKSKETIQKVTENVGDLELQLKREQQRVINGQQENAQLRQRIDGIQLKFAINQSKIEEEFAKKDLLICKLRKMHSDKYSITPTSSKCSESTEEPTPSGPSEPSTSNPEATGKSPRWHLIKWQKIKDKITMDQVLNEQKDMIERLISVTQDREVKNLAEYELTRFEGTKTIYLQIVEMNIQKIKKTDNFSNLLPIPDYPKLSPEFLEKFTEEMKNQPEVSEVGLSPETNCYICFEPYVDKDVKKICKECNTPVHLECDDTWRSKQKEQNIPDDDTCGFCRGKMEEKKGGKKEKKK